jgi:hypothetical protein
LGRQKQIYFLKLYREKSHQTKEVQFVVLEQTRHAKWFLEQVLSNKSDTELKFCF